MISKNPLIMMAIAAVTLAAGHARAQSPEPTKDAQSSYEPRSRPGAGQKYLESFVGDWDVVKVFHPPRGSRSGRRGRAGSP